MAVEGWEEVKLKDIAEYRRGSFPQPYGLPKWYDEENGYPFVQVFDIDKNLRLKPQTKNKISEEAAQQSVFIGKGTLIVSIQGSIGRIAITQYDAYVDRTVLLFKRFLKPLNKIFFANALQCLFEIEKVRAPGGTIKTITKEVLSDFSINLPPLPEQKKIAEILGSVDDAIAKTEAVIAQTERVKQGLLQQLLTCGIGHTKFKQTEIGEIPESWEYIPLGNIIAELRAGVSVNSENRMKATNESGILKTSAVTYGCFLPQEHKTILEHELERAKVNPKQNSIIFSRMNTPTLVGASVYIEKDYPDLFLPDRLWLFVPQDCKEFNMHWLSYLLGAPFMRDIISGIATGTSGSMKNISKKKLLNLHIPLPNNEEQKRIVKKLYCIDNMIFKIENKLKKLQILKSGLMSDLLTGRMRVNATKTDEVAA